MAITTEYKKIRIRRGLSKDISLTKLVAGEFALLTDTKKLYACITPGEVREFGTREDLEQYIDGKADGIEGRLGYVATAAINGADAAADNANAAASNADGLAGRLEAVYELIKDAEVGAVAAGLEEHASDATAHVTTIATTEKAGLMAPEMVDKLGGMEPDNYAHPDSGVTAGTYTTVTVDGQGHVADGANPIMAVAQGGTGAATAADARGNLHAAGSDDLAAHVDDASIHLTLESVMLMAHPVGSIYMSADDADPSSLFGGKWSAWGAGRVPVGINESDADFGTAGKTGGEKAHKLAASELPAHAHGVGSLSVASGGAHQHAINLNKTSWGTSGAANNVIVDSTDYTALSNGATSSAGSHGHSVGGTTGTAGSGAAHNNLQPYITCYMWKRTE